MADKWKGISGVAQKADPSGKYRWNFGENGIFDPNNILPYGLKGQIIKVDQDNTNIYSAYDPLVYGSFITTDAELTAAKDVFIDYSEIFQEWQRFAHGGNPEDPLGVLIDGKMPVIADQTNSWAYDAGTNVINSTLNTGSHIGFISKIKLQNYTHRATLTTSSGDNDRIGVIIAFVEDQPQFVGDTSHLVTNEAYGMDPGDFTWPIDVTSEFIPRQHTLVLFREREVVGNSYCVKYDFNLVNPAKLIVNGSDQVWQTTDGWLGAEVDVEIVRSGDLITVKTSNFSDAPGGKGPLAAPLEIDLNSDPLLYKFKGACAYGYCAQSQAFAQFTDLSIDNGINEIFDLRDGSVWVADDSGVYSIDVNRNVFNELPAQCFIRNQTTNLFAFIKKDNSVDIISQSAPATSTSSGAFDDTDEGQSEILIPHGLDGTPGYWDVRGKNTAAKNVVNASNESADATNIILTPDFMNNDGATLNFLWEAKL